MIHITKHYPNEVTIVTTGPLSNIAEAAKKDQDFP
jgi:inosine-uridine nucleoside N-ribohydrolase